MKIAALNIEQMAGKNTVSRHDGKILYEKIKELWETNDQVLVDFGNLVIASVSFMDEVFGHLALEYPRDELRKRLKLLHINDYDRALLNDIILSRVRQRNLEAHKKNSRKRSVKVGHLLKRGRSNT